MTGIKRSACLTALSLMLQCCVVSAAEPASAAIGGFEVKFVDVNGISTR